jgi:integrase
MKRHIGVDLVRKLPTRNVDIRDTKLPGFLIRCRTSGVHSYLCLLGRGRVMTLGKVSVLTPHEARAVARLALADVAHGIDPTAGRRRGPPAWGSYVTDTYQPWAVANRKTGAMTVARLTAVFSDFDSMPLISITAFAVERWRTARHRAGITPATTNRDLAALRGALSKAVEWKLLTAHPLAAVKDAHVDAVGRIRFLDADEDARLHAALTARDDRLRGARAASNRWRAAQGFPLLPPIGRFAGALTPLVLTALHTGCRRGELFSLHWRDIDLPAARLTVRGVTAKSGSTRVIPLNTTIVDVLTLWRPERCDLEGFVFPNRHGGRLKEIKDPWAALLKAASITNFTFHGCRHTFASRLVQAGVDLNRVRQLLGHSDLKQTLRYSHLRAGDLADAVATLTTAR